MIGVDKTRHPLSEPDQAALFPHRKQTLLLSDGGLKIFRHVLPHCGLWHNNKMIKPPQLRAWWAHKQGLDGSLMDASPQAILEKVGWARSVGGANPYLTLFARGEISRETADRAAADLQIHELP